MKQRSFLLPLTLCIAGWLLYAGLLAYSDDIRTPGPNGEPGPDTVSWIMVAPYGKTALGAQLHAPKSSPTTITAALNPTTQASGFVATGGPYPDCACINHYHGSLLGIPDPDPQRCGWGCVEPYDAMRASVQFYSAAVMLEARALTRLDVNPPNLSAALQDMNTALEQLNGLEEEVANEGLSSGTVNKVKASIEKVKSMDNQVISGINALSAGNGSRSKTEKVLQSAIANKQKGLTTLLKALKVTGR